MQESIRLEITIPLFYNDKEYIPLSVLKSIRDDLIRKFGGLSVIHNNEGYWLDNGCCYQDNNDIYIVVTKELNLDWLEHYKKWLIKVLHQHDIFMVLSKVKIV